MYLTWKSFVVMPCRTHVKTMLTASTSWEPSLEICCQRAQHSSYTQNIFNCIHFTSNQLSFSLWPWRRKLLTLKHPRKCWPLKQTPPTRIPKSTGIIHTEASQWTGIQIQTNIPRQCSLPHLIPIAHWTLRKRRWWSSPVDCTLPAAHRDRQRSVVSTHGWAPLAAWETSFQAGSPLWTEQKMIMIKSLHACWAANLICTKQERSRQTAHTMLW